MIANKNWILANYKRFNEKYFSNELPEIKAKLSRAKSYLGRAFASFDFDTKGMCDYTISISTYFDFPEDVMFSTLLHEMIHIKDYYFNGKEIYRDYWSQKKHRGHGCYFLKEATRITEESGYQIDVKASSETMSKGDLSEATKKAQETPFLIAIAKNSLDKYCVARLPKKCTEDDIKSAMSRYGYERCTIMKGVFPWFKEKRGSLKSFYIMSNAYVDENLKGKEFVKCIYK